MERVGVLDDALADVRVVQIGGRAAQFCGYVLRAYGAVVDWVELAGSRQSADEVTTVAFGDGQPPLRFAPHSADDARRLDTLIGAADILVLEPQELPAEHGLDVAGLRERHPQLIVTTITPFGMSGPYADYLGGDLVAAAMSGFLHLTGEPGQEPVRIGADQSLKLGGAEAASGSMVALFARDATGRGQHVDVAVRDAVIRATVHALPKFEYEGVVQQRVGDHWGVRDRPLRALWRCQDGWVSFVRRGGAMGARVNPACVEWMAECGVDVDHLRGHDWGSMDIGDPDDRAIFDRLDEAFESFLAQWRTDDAFEEGLRRGMTLAPVRTIPTILTDVHLHERDFWDEVDVEGRSVLVPGRFVRAVDAASSTDSTIEQKQRQHV